MVPFQFYQFKTMKLSGTHKKILIGVGIIVGICIIIVCAFIPLILLVDERASAFEACNGEVDMDPGYKVDFCLENNNICFTDAEVLYVQHTDLDIERGYKAEFYDEYEGDLIGICYVRSRNCYSYDEDGKKILLGTLRPLEKSQNSKYDIYQCDEEELLYEIKADMDSDFTLYSGNEQLLKSVDNYWDDSTDAPDITLVDMDNELVSIIYTKVDGMPDNIWKVINLKLDSYSNWIIGSFSFVANLK